MQRLRLNTGRGLRFSAVPPVHVEPASSVGGLGWGQQTTDAATDAAPTLEDPEQGQRRWQRRCIAAGQSSVSVNTDATDADYGVPLLADQEEEEDRTAGRASTGGSPRTASPASVASVVLSRSTDAVLDDDAADDDAEDDDPGAYEPGDR